MKLHAIAFGVAGLLLAGMAVLGGSSAVAQPAGPKVITGVCKAAAPAGFSVSISYDHVHGHAQAWYSVLYGESSSRTDLQPITQGSQSGTVTSAAFPLSVAGQSPVMIEVQVQRVRGGGLRAMSIESQTQAFADVPWCSSAPQIAPTSGTAGTAFTLVDPLGRMVPGDIVLFYTLGTPPESGVQVTDAAISSDGTMATGTVPIFLTTGDYGVTVRANPTSPSRFPDLVFTVTP